MLPLANPFPGLRSFKPSEKHLFFGRERHIQEILRKLNTFRFVSVVGNSGSGKSSLVKAGVLPEIQNNLKEYKQCIIRPGSAPIFRLAKALIDFNVVSNYDNSSDGVSFLNKTLNKGDLGLVQAVRPNLKVGEKLLLVVDQFEELFRYENEKEEESESTASQFVNLLLGAINQTDVPIYVMMTIRTDFLGDCEQFLGLPEAINDGQFLVPRMNKDEVKSCITGPVHLANGKISPRLVNHLSNAVGSNPDQLPILQHVMMRTWERWIAAGSFEQPIDLHHYEETGGMQMALSNHAEEAYAELKSDRDKLIAETLFKTITVKGSDNRGVRRPTSVSSIAKIASASVKEIIAVASVFRSHGRGFIMPSISTDLSDDSILDISHESLMRVWERLKKWVENEGDSADLYARITESALLYQQGMSGLWRDPDLQIALDWLAHNPNEAWAMQYNEHFASTIRFIEASKQDKLFVHKDRLRKRKIRNMTVLGILVILSMLTLWAFKERNNASLSAKDANEKKIEAEKQRQMAEINLNKAQIEEKKASNQKKEAEFQKVIAESNAKKAQSASIFAQSEAERSRIAEAEAEHERQLAMAQTIISDSMRNVAEEASNESSRLRMLSVAQNLAIRSKLMQASTNQELKAMLAIQAYFFNRDNKGKSSNREIFEAIFSALRTYETNDNYNLRGYKDAANTVMYLTNQKLATVCSDGSLHVNNLELKTQEIYQDSKYSLEGLAYNRSTKLLAVANGVESILIFNEDNLSSPIRLIKSGHTNKIVKLIWVNGEIASLSGDSTLRIHHVNKTIKSIELSFKPTCAALESTGNNLYIGGSDGVIYRMKLSDQSVEVFSRPKRGSIMSLAFDSELKLVAYGTNAGFCELLNSEGQSSNNVLAGHKAGVSSIQFDKFGKYVATASYDGKVRMFLLNQPNQPAIEFLEHDSWVLDLCFNPSSNNLASAGKDKKVLFYPVDLEAMVQSLQSNINGKLSKEDWELYIGSDIPYQLYLDSL